MNENVFQFKKIENENCTEILIYGEIRKENRWDCFFENKDGHMSALCFKEALDKVETDKIRVRINSNGGSVTEGLSIYSLLIDCGKEIETIVDGIAASIASVIFMAGSKRIIPEHCLLMIHNAWTSEVSGNANELRKIADDLDKYTEPAKRIYESKCNISKDEITKLMDNETILLSDEAFKYGFATAVERKEIIQAGIDLLYNSEIKNRKFIKEINDLKSQIIELKNEKEKKYNDKSWDLFFNGRNDKKCL